MKKLLFAVPIFGTMLFSISCTKEPETITETVTVTQTDTVYVNSTDTITVTQTDTLDERTTAAIIIEKFDQLYFSSTDTYASAEVFYAGLNLGDEKISMVSFECEALAADATTYTTTAYLFDLWPNIKSSDKVYIDTDGKKCLSVSVKSVMVTK